MPSFAELENPEYYLAAQVLSEDGVLLARSVKGAKQFLKNGDLVKLDGDKGIVERI